MISHFSSSFSPSFLLLSSLLFADSIPKWSISAAAVREATTTAAATTRPTTTPTATAAGATTTKETLDEVFNLGMSVSSFFSSPQGWWYVLPASLKGLEVRSWWCEAFLFFLFFPPPRRANHTFLYVLAAVAIATASTIPQLIYRHQRRRCSSLHGLCQTNDVVIYNKHTRTCSSSSLMSKERWGEWPMEKKAEPSRFQLPRCRRLTPHHQRLRWIVLSLGLLDLSSFSLP